MGMVSYNIIYQKNHFLDLVSYFIYWWLILEYQNICVENR